MTRTHRRHAQPWLGWTSLAAVLAGCAAAPAPGPAAAWRLDAAALRALTDTAVRHGLSFDDAVEGGDSWLLNPDSTLAIRNRGMRHVRFGRWRLRHEPALLCLQPEGQAERCSAVYRLTSGRYLIDTPALPEAANTLTLALPRW